MNGQHKHAHSARPGRRRGLILAAGGVAAAIVAAVLALTIGGSPGNIVAHGSEEISVSPLDGTTATDAFPDITAGSQVTVVNSSGQVIGTGTLSAGLAAGEWAQFYDFTVTVPGGLPRYGIQIGSGHGTVWFTAQQMQHGPGLCLGDDC